MAIEIVSFPIWHGDFPVRYVAVDQRLQMAMFNSCVKSQGGKNQQKFDGCFGSP